MIVTEPRVSTAEEAADDRVAAGHALHADCQGDGHDGREAFGDGGNDKADCGHKHVAEGESADEVSKSKGAGCDDKDGGTETATELVHLPDEWRGDGLDFGEEAADFADFGR